MTSDSTGPLDDLLGTLSGRAAGHFAPDADIDATADTQGPIDHDRSPLERDPYAPDDDKLAEVAERPEDADGAPEL